MKAKLLSALVTGEPIGVALERLDDSEAEPAEVKGCFEQWVADGFFVGVAEDWALATNE